MKVYVIKALGSGNFIETELVNEIPWLSYRKFQIDTGYMNSLVNSLAKVSKAYKLAFICGGMGAYLFINMAKALNLNDKILNNIGCSIINLNSNILLEALINKGVKVCPSLVSALDNYEEYFINYDLLFFKAIPEFSSTDSLAAHVSSKLIDTELIFFKKGVPIYYDGFEKPTKVSEFRIEELEDISENYIETPGKNYIIDYNSIRIIKKHRIKVTLFNADDIINLAELIEKPQNFERTTILY
jgi:uridylate kinase